MPYYIRVNDRNLFPQFNDTMRNLILSKCRDRSRSVILINNLTDLEKVWSALPDSTIDNYFNNYLNLFYDYRINTSNPNRVDDWCEKFTSRLFLYLDENQVFNNLNAMAFDTEVDRYTLTKWHSYDERHKDGEVDKSTGDNRSYDYPQYTTEVVTPSIVPNLTQVGSIIDNETTIEGVLTSSNINDNKSVTTRDTVENQTVNTKSGDSDYKESWSIPKEVIAFATQRFQQLMMLKPINYDAYYDWMLSLFITFYTQSDDYS